MLKLILQIAVAAALWFGLQFLNLGVPWRLVAIVLGAIVVHFVWERFIFNPYLYLGAMPVSDDDPIMQKAFAEAKSSVARFLELFPDHREDSMVKFRFTTNRGTAENLWADLLEVDGRKAKVFVRTPPVEHDGEFERSREIHIDDITDWQIEFPDGTIRGGYTSRALFKIYERQEGHLHPKFRAQWERFRELDEVPAV